LNIRYFIIFILLFYVFVARGADTFTINLNNTSPVQYCSTSVLVAPSITVTASFQITGLKVSFSQGYISGEDELTYTAPAGSAIVGTWYSTQGYLLLQGNSGTTVQNYQDAIGQVQYKNDKLIPTLGHREISISLMDADYFPETNHFYKYVPNTGITWLAAKADADTSRYFGLQGYLATITSADENQFISQKSQGVGWIGASDAAAEGQWRWVTGPEGLYTGDNGIGLLFWMGTGANYASRVPGTGPYLGRYSNWNSGEPNNSGGNENYAHVLYNSNVANASFKWNDLPNANGRTSQGLPVQGYLVEYGGMPGDPAVSLSATLDLQVNTLLFKTGPVPAICAHDTVTLNQPDKSYLPAVYSWRPSASLTNASIANPVASPAVSTDYTVTGTRGVCVDSMHYAVPVNPLPVVNLGNDTTICNPATIVLDAGAPYASYRWSPGSETTRSVVVKTFGNYSVAVSDSHGCKTTDQIKVSFTNNPSLDFSKLDTLICGRKSDLLDVGSDKGSFTVRRLSDGFDFSDLNVSVPGYGTYQFLVRATDSFSCYSDSTVKLGFHDIPTVALSIDSTTCYHYNLNASYLGNADLSVAGFTWVFGGDTIFSGKGLVSETIPLGVNQSKRDLVLNVLQNGCSNHASIPDIRVIPTLGMSVKDSILCMPSGFEFSATNTETGVGYAWEFGDGTFGTGTNPTHPYSQSGRYDVRLTVTTSKSCSNSAWVRNMVFAAPIPDVAFTLSAADCLPPGNNQISYAGVIGTAQDTYHWDLSGLGAGEIIQDPAHTGGPLVFDPTVHPMFTLGLQVTSFYGCQSAAQQIVLKRKPDFTMIADQTAGCIPFKPAISGKVSDQIDQVAFSWDFGDGTTGKGSSVTHTYGVPDKKYTISLSGKSSVTGCSSLQIFTDTLESYPQPVAGFSMSDSIVYNDKPKVDFINTSTGSVNWLWDFGDGFTSALENPTHNYTVTGHRTVELRVNNAFNCTDSVSHHVLIAFDRIFTPNGFSPNASNVLDRVFLLDAEGIISEGYDFTVLSRWDDIVFEAKGEKKGWDGRMKNGSFAPAGVYLWVLGYTDFLGRKHRQQGTVTVIY